MKIAGDGPPLVYLHAAGGPIWDDFVEGLTERFTVYAPHHPGTGDTVREFDLFRSRPCGISCSFTTRFSTLSKCHRCLSLARRSAG